MRVRARRTQREDFECESERTEPELDDFGESSLKTRTRKRTATTRLPCVPWPWPDRWRWRCRRHRRPPSARALGLGGVGFMVGETVSVAAVGAGCVGA